MGREAREKGKRIEFVGMLAAFISLAVAVAGLVYTIKKTDALEDRVTAFERAAPKPALSKP